MKNMERSDVRSMKKVIRDSILEKRSRMTEEEAASKSLIIMEYLTGLPEYKKAERILAYVDFRNEVRTAGLISRALSEGKHVAVPKCREHEMDFIEISDISDLKKGAFGILEPDYGTPVIWGDALMIMPGAVFDRQLNRIGYGGGYYDRYLSVHPVHMRVALAFDLQVCDEITAEDTDIKPSMLITENGFYVN